MNQQVLLQSLTPAEQGILAAIVDDAFSLQAGDDDTIQSIQDGLACHPEFDFNDCDAAYDLAYAAFLYRDAD